MPTIITEDGAMIFYKDWGSEGVRLYQDDRGGLSANQVDACQRGDSPRRESDGQLR
jgi:hypothetical protein